MKGGTLLLLLYVLDRIGAFKELRKYLYSLEKVRMLVGIVPLVTSRSGWKFTHTDLHELDLTGKTTIVTGSNIGLGYWTAKHLASRGATVILACRSMAKATAAAAQMHQELTIEKREGMPHEQGVVECIELDLASFESIKRFAECFASKYPVLDALILNAGVVMPAFNLTDEGLECQMGVNHVGHSFLTRLLLPLMKTKPGSGKGLEPASIVVLSSQTHANANSQTLKRSLVLGTVTKQEYKAPEWYANSKLANILFSKQLAKEVGGSAEERSVIVNSLHPGVVFTMAGRHVLEKMNKKINLGIDNWFTLYKLLHGIMWHPKDAALSSVYLAFGKGILAEKVTGCYFHPIGYQLKPSTKAMDSELQEEIWTKTVSLIATLEEKYK